MSKIINSEILDVLLYGRVNPQIYAFNTNTIPNYLKIGDTYRPLMIRMDEWKKKYPDLNLEYYNTAMINEEIFFRDYSVHKFLLDKGFERLSKEILDKINNEIYYSDEFFQGVKTSNLDDAIQDIIEKYPNQLYDYYSIFNPSLPQVEKYNRTEKYKPRNNQEETIEKFKKAIKTGNNKLLMYAVMRFGKTITSLWCAKEMDAKVIVAVSGKADVKEEWRKTLESHVDFGNPEYIFLTSNDLKKDKNLIRKTLDSGRRVLLFFTLQDFLIHQKINETLIKEKHKELFEFSNNGEIDLLLVDETHYGARAKEFRKVLEEDDSQDIDLLYELPKTISSKVTIHLSGTPYKILMGSEFKKDDIIAFYQYSDIVDDQQKWINNEENLEKDEWENPYYGFPQMIRFAFNLNKRSRDRVAELKRQGVSFSLNELFKPKSISEDKITNQHKIFEYEEEVLDFLKTIDHKDDEELMSFLNNEKIKEGKLCNHMVFVLPYRSSCDAMEEVLLSHKNEFKNLNKYKILNISGHNQLRKYNSEKGIVNIKKDIELHAMNNQKTITLTVNRMLTGSTVKEWDTMVYLKSNYSPQEYDQAVFRLQNPWVQEYKDENDKIIKFNMKPQTLLIDFDPTRMFVMVEEKSKIYNVNVYKNGNDELRNRIEKELSISPLLWVDSNKLSRVTPTNIIDAIREYSSNKSVMDEAKSIPADLSLLENPLIKLEIERQSEIGGRGGLNIEPYEGEEIDFGDDFEDISPIELTEEEIKEIDENVDKYSKKIATLYSRILFFSFLTKNKVESLSDIIDVILLGEDNPRIAYNLKINKKLLILIKNQMNPFILSALDYKVQNINSLSNDETLNELERAHIAIKHFDRFSDSEVGTPDWIVEDIISNIDDSNWQKMVNNGNSLLDVASKSGEFAIKVYEKLYSLGYDIKDFSNLIVSIPTSSFAYEFTRKTYEILGLNVNLVSERFTSYKIIDFLEKPADQVYEYFKNIDNYTEQTIFKYEEMKNMRFDIIVGNPPYQDRGGSGGSNDAPIYQHFVDFSLKLKPKISSMIIQARWFSAGRENLLGNFRREMINNSSLKTLYMYTNASDVFPSVEIKGGVCYFVIDESYNGLCDYTYNNNGEIMSVSRKLNDFSLLIRDPIYSEIVKKVEKQNKEDKRVSDLISGDTPFGIPSNPKTSKKNPFVVNQRRSRIRKTKLFYIEKGVRKIGYVDGTEIKKNINDIDKHKIYIPVSGGSGDDAYVLGKPEYGFPLSVCSQSYLYSAFNSKEEADNFIKYLNTKFLRTLVASIKTTPQGSSGVYRYVPIQNFTNNSDIPWEKEVEEIDEYLFKKYKLTKKQIHYINKTIGYFVE